MKESMRSDSGAQWNQQVRQPIESHVLLVLHIETRDIGFEGSEHDVVWHVASTPDILITMLPGPLTGDKRMRTLRRDLRHRQNLKT